MSPVAIGLDVLLAALLLCTLALGVRLNGRLKALREGQGDFVKAVGELDAAAARAEAGLRVLRQASEETHDSLLDRIEAARGLVARLERATLEAQRAFAHPAPGAAADPGGALAPSYSGSRHPGSHPGGSLAAIAALAEGAGGASHPPGRAGGRGIDRGRVPPSAAAPFAGAPGAGASSASASSASASSAGAPSRRPPARSTFDEDLFGSDPPPGLGPLHDRRSR